MNIVHTTGCLILLVALGSSPQTLANSDSVSLQQAIEAAQARDPWLQGSLLQQQALEAQSIAAGTLPDPRLELGFANLPIDSFDFDQEPMTQFKVGVSQMFPRGDSLQLQQQQFALLGVEQTQLRADRQARVAVLVASLWLEAYQAQETVRLIERDRALFEYLVDVTQSSYATGYGKTRQQDLIRAQLELTRLDDRLSALQQSHNAASGKLGEWLGSGYLGNTHTQWQQASALGSIRIAGALPELEVLFGGVLRQPGELEPNWLATQLLGHPAILGLDQKISAERTNIGIAEQKYKPQWGVNASYGYREDAPNGMNRDDFFSIGVSFDLPLFTERRQDKEVQSAVARTEAMKTQKWLALRNMQASLMAARANLLGLEQRQALYRNQLLQQMHEQAEASLNAYINDDGDFAEVVRARIAELNTHIEALTIDVEHSRVIAQINYFFAGTELAPQLTAEVSP